METALNLKPSLDKATEPRRECEQSCLHKKEVWATKRKNTSQELTEAEKEKPLAEHTVTASKHGKNTHAKINTMPKPLVNRHRITESNKSQRLMLSDLFCPLFPCGAHSQNGQGQPSEMRVPGSYAACRGVQISIL